MKSNMTFLAPLLAGIILGLSGMISTILSSISAMFDSEVIGGGEVLGAEGIGGLLGFFDPVQMIPTYWLQIVIGIYLIEIVFILTSTLVTIKSGRDPLQTTSETGKNLKRTITLYFIVALASIVGLSLIGAIALSGLT
jgi:hypothetical protein